MRPRLYAGDCRKWLAEFAEQGIQFDAVVTDPPYNIESIVKRFGKPSYKAAGFGEDGVFERSSERFVGQTWDASTIAQDSSFWTLVLNVMKPGAYLFAFGFSRTIHRQTVAIEEAGFIIHPQRVWHNRQGMPKPHPVDKAMLRSNDPDVQAQASAWKGWAYGAQSYRPALEPIAFAQKPFSEKNGPLNIIRHGVGAVNIDAVRGPNGEYPTNYVDEVFEAPKANARDRAGSKHPSVKPIALIQDLCRASTPPGGTILDPFAGSGTTGEAAQLEGFQSYLIEQDRTFRDDIMRRFGNRAHRLRRK